MRRYEEKECVMWFTQILSSVQQQQSLVLKCWTSKDICRYDKNYYQFGFHVKLASYGQEDGLRNTHATDRKHHRTCTKGRAGWGKILTKLLSISKIKPRTAIEISSTNHGNLWQARH